MSGNVSEIELGCVHANLVVTSSKEHNAKSRLLLIVWSCPPTPYITARGLPQLLHTQKMTLAGKAGAMAMSAAREGPLCPSPTENNNSQWIR
ncbi:hypothetical protein B296_00013763 [Ensete ventricosum]|uniref:Uncharacterized protein n=1 Tax=Ensete ventricosum TaxID=4639 RepID=A0A427A0B4_ENSVE|nr:hypothetical protein B296_00013763 [Ensete ventricosum]